jgi:hypothetical protein
MKRELKTDSPRRGRGRPRVPGNYPRISIRGMPPALYQELRLYARRSKVSVGEALTILVRAGFAALGRGDG